MRRCLLIVAAALLALPSAAPAQTVKFRTVAKGDGSSSSIARRQALTIRSERRWRSVWNDLGHGGKRREIDFSKHMLIAVTQGRQPSGGHEIRVERIARRGSGWVVRVAEIEPGSGCITTGVITNPYHVVRVPRTARRVSFERRSVERACSVAM